MPCRHNAVVLNTVNTEQLAEEISHATTTTYADIMGVLIELSNVMKCHLLNSDKVSLYRLGSFRAGIKTTAADTKEDFNANNITGYRIIYSPEISFTPMGVTAKASTPRQCSRVLRPWSSAQVRQRQQTGTQAHSLYGKGACQATLQPYSKTN